MGGNRKRPSTKRSLDFGDNNKDSTGQGNDEVVDLTGSSPAATPQKKNKKRDLKSYFSSPVPSTSASATSKGTDSVAVVTPPEAKRQKLTTKDEGDAEQQQEEGHVPVYIHKNVSYVRKGKSELDPITEKTYNLVACHYVIPTDFENTRSYGPLSGVSYEQRVITCYTNNLLKPKDESGESIDICTHCADVGHTRDDCQDLL